MIDLVAFCDSESSGLWRKDLDDDNPSQPHLLELAVKVVDGKRRFVRQFSTIVRPDGWSIEPSAFEKHGLSEEYCNAVGAPLDLALAAFKLTLEGVTKIVGHGIIGFDYPLISLAVKRAGSENLWWRKFASRIVDTIELSTPILGLPGKFGDKYPTLEEAARFFGHQWTSQHRAAGDIEAVERVFWGIIDHERRSKNSPPVNSLRTILGPQAPA